MLSPPPIIELATPLQWNRANISFHCTVDAIIFNHSKCYYRTNYARIKVAPYGSEYFWTFQRYDFVNVPIIFFYTRHDNRTALEFLEAILDNISVTIGT